MKTYVIILMIAAAAAILPQSKGIETGLYLVLPKNSHSMKNSAYKVIYLSDTLYLKPKAILTVNDIESSSTDSTNLDGKEAYVLNIKLKSSAAIKFKTVTAENVGRKLALVIDNKVVMAAIIKDPITTGRLTVSGESAAEIKSLGIKLSKEIVKAE